MAFTGTTILAASAALAAAIVANIPAERLAAFTPAAEKSQARVAPTPPINVAPAHRTLVSVARTGGSAVKPGCAAQVWPNIARECLTVQAGVEIKVPTRTILLAESSKPRGPAAGSGAEPVSR
jgi:hypothetical protein